MKRSEFWTLFYYGSNETICDKHKTPQAAIRAAAKCEKSGGADHRIVEVIEVVPYQPRKKGAK